MSTRPHRGHRRRPRSKNKSAGAGPRKEHIQELHPVDRPPEIDSFTVWDLGEEIQGAIRNMDITVPTPIQALAIGPVLAGRDVIAKAETGTGKTLAFGAPMMARIDPARAAVLGLVLCPTRELAQQVAGVLEALAFPRGVRVALVVGGDPIHPQIAALQAGAQVVVGTPGRVLDLYQQRFLQFPWTEYVVLDEADKMFEIGFLDDVRKILSFTPEERQTLLFSATFPTEVLKLARSSTKDPLEVATAAGTVTVDLIDQRWMELDEEERPMALIRVLEQSGKKDVFLVFCGRRTEVDRLMRRLERLSFTVKALHGGYDQAARFRVMSAFRTGEVKALVATDVASRGLDVQLVTHVVNYSVPRDLEDYTHRIGRTGRAGRAGTAITFVVPSERGRWRRILPRVKDSAREMEPPGRTGARRPRERDEAPPERDASRAAAAEAAPERPRRERERRERPPEPEGGRRRRSRKPARSREHQNDVEPTRPPSPVIDVEDVLEEAPRERGRRRRRHKARPQARSDEPGTRDRIRERPEGSPASERDPGGFGAGL